MPLGVDDWMRVTRGAWPARTRPTSADRRTSLVMLIVCVLVVSVGAAWGGWHGVALVGGFVGLGLVHAVQVVRLRHLGWERQ